MSRPLDLQVLQLWTHPQRNRKRKRTERLGAAVLSAVARAQLRTVDRNLAEDCLVSDRVLRFDRQRRAALRASPGSDNKNVRLCVDQSALRLVHQTSALSQAQAQLLQLAIGYLKFRPSDRFAAASTDLNHTLTDHFLTCIHY